MGSNGYEPDIKPLNPGDSGIILPASSTDVMRVKVSQSSEQRVQGSAIKVTQVRLSKRESQILVEVLGWSSFSLKAISTVVALFWLCSRYKATTVLETITSLPQYTVLAIRGPEEKKTAHSGLQLKSWDIPGFPGC